MQNGKACVFGRLGRQKERSRRSSHKTIELIRVRLRIWHLNRRFLLFAASRFAAQLFGKHRQRIGFFSVRRRGVSSSRSSAMLTTRSSASILFRTSSEISQNSRSAACASTIASSRCFRAEFQDSRASDSRCSCRRRSSSCSITIFLPNGCLECHSNEGYFNRGPVWRLWAILSKVMIRVGFGIDQTESGAQKSDP